MRQFLRRGPEQQAVMLTALRERLQRDLERRPDALFGKEWVRVARLYQRGYRHRAQQELEAAKDELRAEIERQRALPAPDATSVQGEAVAPRAEAIAAAHDVRGGGRRRAPGGCGFGLDLREQRDHVRLP